MLLFNSNIDYLLLADCIWRSAGVSGDGLQASTAQLQVEDASASGSCVGAGTESKSPPDDVILFMLRREALLTRAKLHFLVFEHFTQEKELRILKQALRQVRQTFQASERMGYASGDKTPHEPMSHDIRSPSFPKLLGISGFPPGIAILLSIK